MLQINFAIFLSLTPCNKLEPSHPLRCGIAEKWDSRHLKLNSKSLNLSKSYLPIIFVFPRLKYRSNLSNLDKRITTYTDTVFFLCNRLFCVRRRLKISNNSILIGSSCIPTTFPREKVREISISCDSFRIRPSDFNPSISQLTGADID